MTDTPGPFLLVAVHGGAGHHAESKTLDAAIKHAMQSACACALQSLHSGQQAIQAATGAIVVLEDAECLNAGYGSNLTLDGIVECDASIMTDSGDFGSVGAVSGVKNPIRAASVILEHSKAPDKLGRIPPILLVGEGARSFAARAGAVCVPPESLVCSRARQEWQRWKQQLESNSRDDQAALNIQELHKMQDTVGAISWDSYGHTAAGVSSGGLLLKFAGRVGEAATFSAGCWAQTNAQGMRVSCSVSGSGEYIIRTGLAKTICDTLLNDADVDAHEVLHKCLSHFYDTTIARGEPEPNAGVILGVQEIDNGSGDRAHPRLWCAFTSHSMAIAYASSLDPKPKARILRRPAQAHQSGAPIYITALSLTR